MSLEVSNFYWERCPGVKGSERLVILALANFCNESGWCFPSVSELARRCALSDRGTQKILARLAEGGHIAVEANEGRRKTRGSPTHRYHLLAYQRSLAAAKGELARSPLAVEKGEQMCSPIAMEKGEQFRSPFGPQKGEQIDGKGEQIDKKGERASSPERYRSVKDPNTTADAAAAKSPAPADYQKVVKAYHNEIGTLTPIIEKEIKAELAASSAEWVIRAIGIAAMRNHRRWAYVAGILRRWHADGFDGEMDNPGSKTGSRTPGKTGSSTGSKSMGYGRQEAPAPRAKGQSIEDYADDPEYYEQLKALYAGGDPSSSSGSNSAHRAAGVGAE